MNLLDKAKQDSLNLLKAQNEFDESFDKWLESLELCSENTFWHLLGKYQQLLLDRELDNDKAADEFFRQAIPEVKGTWTYTHACQFLKTYESKVEDLYDPLFDITGKGSDDSYSDLLDSLPLAGEKVYNDCLKSKFHKDDLDNEFRHFIWDGENYIRLFLKNAAKDKFYICMCHKD